MNTVCLYYKANAVFTARPYTNLLLVLCFLLGSAARAQQVKNRPNYPDRYQLDLPADWMKKPKLIRTITDILPKTLSQLEEKQFCTECRAGMRVSLLIDSLEVINENTSAPTQVGQTSRYTYSFNYSFYAALLLTDSNGHPLSLLRLNDAAELMSYSKEFSMQAMNATYRREPVYDTLGRIVSSRIVEEAPAIITDVPRMSPYQVLTNDFILNICLRRIYEIEKYLRKVE